MSVRQDIEFDGGGGGDIGGGGGGAADQPPPLVTTPPPVPSPVQPPPPPATSAIVPAVIASSIRGGYAITLDQIPLLAVPSQTLSVQLANQACRVDVFQKSTGLFLNLSVGAAPIATGVLCRDRVWLVRDAYLGFAGDLCFIDTQAVDDPDWTGLADRFQLFWGH